MKLKSLIALSTLALSASAFAQGSSGTMSNGTTGNAGSAPSNNTGISTGTSGSTTSSTTTTDSSKTAAGGQEATSDMGPKSVCQKLVDATKSTTSQQNHMDQWVYRERGPEGRGNRWRQQMGKKHDQFRSEISQASCGEERIAGDHAFVVATSAGKERLIPFIKQGNMWKLDMASYKTLYRMDRRMPASSSDTSTDKAPSTNSNNSYSQ